MTIAAVQRVLYRAVSNVSVQSAVPVAQREQWIDLLSELSGLSHSLVANIVDFLIYEFDTTRKAKNRHAAEAISQPFFRLSSDQLALSCFMVLSSSAERNLFDLASAKLQKYDDVKKLKENQGSRDLADRFKKFGLHALAQIEYSNGESGDIDLFVIDCSSKVALVVQLKWLLMDRMEKVGTLMKLTPHSTRRTLPSDG